MWGNSVTYHGSKGRIIGTITVLFSLLSGVFLILVDKPLFGLLFGIAGAYELLKLLFQPDYSISFSSSQGDSGRR